MIKNDIKISRKTINEDQIAICPNFGCSYLKRVKPLKLGFLGFHKYPKCPKHKFSLVFIDEFVGDFLQAVNACLFDASSTPPSSLLHLIMKSGKNEFRQLINIWMYSNPIGRGSQLVSKYMGGLSKSYMKELSRKQKRYLKGEKSSKKRYEILRNNFKKITTNYTNFARSLYEKYEVLHNTKNIRPISSDMKSIVQDWLGDFLKTIQTTFKIDKSMEESPLHIKNRIDMILQAGTCSVILGKVPKTVIKGLTAFELFSSYFSFLNGGLCNELTLEDLKNLVEEPEEFLNISFNGSLNEQEFEPTTENFNEIMKEKLRPNILRSGEMRKKIALCFFKLIIENKNTNNFELVSLLKHNIENNSNFCDVLSKSETTILNNIFSQDKDSFLNYFDTLAEVVRHLILTSEIHLEIRAHITIKYLANSLEKKGITLGQKLTTFKATMIEIYDYIKNSEYSEILPMRSHTQKPLAKEEKYFNRYNDYRKIIGYRIKLYAIKKIYNGKYSYEYKCPYCAEEGFKTNTDISRLKALEFHHESSEKKHEYTTAKFYELYTNDPCNDYFLKDLINRMESEKVILVCRNHHRTRFHNEINSRFQYLINWEKIFSLPAELIHIIIRTSVENFRETRELSNLQKKSIRRLLSRALKKRFILEHLYKDKCPLCEEFDIKQHLGAFDFSHQKEEEKSINASDLYYLHDCGEILKILEKERGMFMCSNCHTVLHNTSLHLLKEIYQDKKIENKVLVDYKNLNKKFNPIQEKESIRAPLGKNLLIDEFIERLLLTLYKFSIFKSDVTSNDLVKEFNLTRSGTLLKSIRRKESFLAELINFTLGKGGIPTKFSLTKKGYNAANLIIHFREYYKSL